MIIDGRRFEVEVASSFGAQRQGLSGRASVPPGTGMLFEFGRRDTREIWMAGMTVPLDIAWIVDESVVQIRTLQPCTATDRSDCQRWSSPTEIDALLEVPSTELSGVRPGSSVIIRLS